MKIVLASASPRRKEILEGIGLSFDIITADIDELNRDFKSPPQAVCELALDKGRAVQKKTGDGPLIIAADTLVFVGGEVMGKPQNYEEAAKMLRRLSNCSHEVFTGVAILHKGREATFSERTEVCFKKISEEQIDEYIKTGEPMDKAGAYAVQGIGGLFVSGIKGDYQNVVGLPLSRLYDVLLLEIGIDLLLMKGKGTNVKLF